MDVEPPIQRTPAGVLKKGVEPFLQGQVGSDSSSAADPRAPQTTVNAYVLIAVRCVGWKPEIVVRILIPADSSKVSTDAPIRLQIIDRCKLALRTRSD